MIYRFPDLLCVHISFYSRVDPGNVFVAYQRHANSSIVFFYRLFAPMGQLYKWILIHLHICTSTHLLICISAHPFIYTFAYLHIHSFAYLHICTSTSFTHLHICISAPYLYGNDIPYLFHRVDSQFCWIHTARKY